MVKKTGLLMLAVAAVGLTLVSAGDAQAFFGRRGGSEGSSGGCYGSSGSYGSNGSHGGRWRHRHGGSSGSYGGGGSCGDTRSCGCESNGCDSCGETSSCGCGETAARARLPPSCAWAVSRRWRPSPVAPASVGRDECADRRRSSHALRSGRPRGCPGACRSRAWA